MNSNSLKPLVDIVITAHNMESCLGECLQSLAAQTFGDFCALIVNDGSTDGTKDVAQAFADTDDRNWFFRCTWL